jgi:hypothetical protein
MHPPRMIFPICGRISCLISVVFASIIENEGAFRVLLDRGMGSTPEVIAIAVVDSLARLRRDGKSLGIC